MSIKVLKTSMTLAEMDGKKYRVISMNKRDFKGIIITELKQENYNESDKSKIDTGVDLSELIDTEDDFDIDLGDLDELEEISIPNSDNTQNNLSALENLTWDSENQDNTSIGLEDLDISNLENLSDIEEAEEIEDLDNNDSKNLDDLDTLFEDIDEINEPSILDIENTPEPENKGYEIYELSDITIQTDVLNIIEGRYSKDYETNSADNITTDDLVDENSLEESDNSDEDVRMDSGLTNTLLNDKKTKVTKYMADSLNKEYTFKGEKLVYHWAYRQTQVQGFEDNEDLFYDLVIREYEYGSYPTALILMNRINEIIRLSVPDGDDRVQQSIERVNYEQRQELTKIKMFSNQEYYLGEYNSMTDKLLMKEYSSEEFTCQIYLINADKYLYTRLIETVPYTERQNYGFSNAFKRSIKENRDRKLRFPKMDFFKKILNLDYVETADYRIIDDEEDLIWLTNEINKLHPDHVIAYDAETTGLKFHKWLKEDERDELVTHSFSWKDNQSVIIPVRMKNRKNITYEQEQKYIKPIMENRVILCHNGKADFLFNKYENINLNLEEDTYVLAKHIMPYLRVDEKTGRSKSRSSVVRSLEYLLRRTFNRDKINLKKYVFNPQGVSFDFSVLPDEYLIYYGCPDTDQLRQLWKVFRPKLRPNQEDAYKANVKFSTLLADKSTFAGIKLSEEVIIENRNKTFDLINVLQSLALKVAGETEDTLNIGSAKQIANYIYGKMGVPVTSRTKKTADGDLSADKYVIAELVGKKRAQPTNMFKKDILDIDGTVLISAEELNKAQYPFMVLLQAYNDNRKNLTAYYDGLINSSINGIYYPEPKAGSTATWRTTERTQITKGIIKDGLEVYDKDEYYMVSMDFSAEELRLAVNQSDDDGYKDILADPERDPHRAAAAQIFNLPEYEVTSKIRKKAKAANFGLIYGMGAVRLSKTMAQTEYINEEQLLDGRKVYNGYKYLYGRMLEPLAKASAHVQKYGWLQNNLGYLMIYDDVLDIEDYERQIFDPNLKRPPEIRLDKERYSEYVGGLKNKAGNYPIQSWAAGLLMMLSLKFADELKKYEIYDKVYIPLTVHDEIDIIVHKSVHPVLIMKILKSVYETTLDGLDKRTVPLFIGIGYGLSWGQAKSDDAEVPVRLQNRLVEEYDRGELPQHIHPRDMYDYFWNRKLDYFKERLKAVFKEEVENKKFHYAEVMLKLRSEIYVLNQCGDLFKIYDAKTETYDFDKILEIICEGEDFTPDDFEIDTDMKIETASEDEKEVDFFFNPVIHDRLFVMGKTVQLDITGLTKTISMTLIKYLTMFKTDNQHLNTKELVIKIADITKPTGIQIRGLPFNAKDIISGILVGEIDESKFNLKTKTVDRSVDGINVLELINKDVDNNIITIHLDIIINNSTKDTQLYDLVKNILIKLNSKGVISKEKTNEFCYKLYLQNNEEVFDTEFYIKDLVIETISNIIL